jgi:hypothetical protein
MPASPQMGRVAVLKTKPETILEDIGEVMRLADFEKALPKDPTTGLKINISWQTWYPACSTEPWQLEVVIRTLKAAGYKDIVGVHNYTVVMDTRVGEFNNKHRFITDQYGIPCTYLYEEDSEWSEYKPSRPLLVLDKVYKEGVFIIDQEPAWGFRQEDTFASHGQKMIYHGALNPLEHLLSRTPLVPWSYFASNFYHNVYWYPFVGRKRVEAALKTPRGILFRSYEDGEVVMPGVQPKTVLKAIDGTTMLAALAIGGLRLLRRR